GGFDLLAHRGVLDWTRYTVDQLAGGLLVVRRLQSGHEFFHHRLVAEWAERAFDDHEPARFPGKLPVELPDDWRAVAVRDQRRRVHFRVAQHGIDGARIQVHRVGDPRLVALPVPRQIDCDDVE